MKNIVLLLAFVAVLVSMATHAQTGALPKPLLLRKWVRSGSLVTGVSVCARGRLSDMTEVPRLSQRCVKKIGERPYTRLVLPPAYIFTQLSAGWLEMHLLSFLFEPWFSRDFNQGYGIQAADDLIDSMLTELPDFTRSEGGAKKHQ